MGAAHVLHTAGGQLLERTTRAPTRVHLRIPRLLRVKLLITGRIRRRSPLLFQNQLILQQYLSLSHLGVVVLYLLLDTPAIPLIVGSRVLLLYLLVEQFMMLIGSAHFYIDCILLKIKSIKMAVLIKNGGFIIVYILYRI